MTPSSAPDRRRALFAGLLAIALASTDAVAASEPGDAVARLQLQARLFHAGSGSFSADVLAPGGPALFNVVAADDPSTSTLVEVVVTLAPGTALASQTPVRLTVREQAPHGGARRTLVDRSLALGAVARGGTVHLGFWLQGTGCRPLQLQARLIPGGSAAPLSAAATVPFACGE